MGYIPDFSWDPCWSGTCRGRRPLSEHLWCEGSTSCGRYGSQLPLGYAWSRGRVSPGSPSCPPSPSRPGNINRPMGFLMGEVENGGLGDADESARRKSRWRRRGFRKKAPPQFPHKHPTAEYKQISGMPTSRCARARFLPKLQRYLHFPWNIPYFGAKNSRDLTRAIAHTRAHMFVRELVTENRKLTRGADVPLFLRMHDNAHA